MIVAMQTAFERDLRKRGTFAAVAPDTWSRRDDLAKLVTHFREEEDRIHGSGIVGGDSA
jgi:hypothetical protein